jgi:hypothetical protein
LGFRNRHAEQHGKTEHAKQMLQPLSQHSFLPTASNDVPDPS